MKRKLYVSDPPSDAALDRAMRVAKVTRSQIRDRFREELGARLRAANLADVQVVVRRHQGDYAPRFAGPWEEEDVANAAFAAGQAGGAVMAWQSTVAMKLAAAGELPMRGRFTRNPAFDPCFARSKIEPWLNMVPAIYEQIERVARRRVSDWPTRIQCMTAEEIRSGRKRGAGHGLYIRYSDGSCELKINRSMPSHAILANFIHENIHHAMPQASEAEVDRLTEVVATRL